MNPDQDTDQFYKIIADFMDELMNTLHSKNAEYTSGNDRLSNFRRAAGLLNGTMEQACFGMMTKHIVSVADLAQRDETDINMWKEKLGDLINYCLLMWVIVKQKQDKEIKEN